MSERSVGRSLARLGLSAEVSRRYRHVIDRTPKRPAVGNWLKRAFRVVQPNRVWVTDITYIRTQQGWVYLAVVLDLFSRQIVGWQMREWC